MGYGYDPVLGKPSHLLPFELIHFEFSLGDTYPDWTPEEDHGWHPVEVIREESQLTAHGIVLDRPVDFTKKSVLYCAIRDFTMPFLIGYGTPLDSGVIREYWGNTDLHAPVMWVHPTRGNENEGKKAAFRLAILVDKEEKYGPFINVSCGVTLVLFEQEAFDRLLHGLYGDNYSSVDYE